MKIFPAKFSALALTSILLASGCNQPLEQKSNLNTDSEAAKKRIEARLNETVQIRKIITALEKALKPIDATLNDVLTVLRSEKDRINGQLPKLAISELRHALESLNKDIAIEQADGSWTIERTVKWPFERVNPSDTSCDSTVVGINARNTTSDGKNVAAEIYLQDCTFTGKKTVAFIESTNGEVKMSFEASALQAMESMSIVKVGSPCIVQVNSKTGEYGMMCTPFDARIEGFTLKFGEVGSIQGIYFDSTPEGEELKMAISTYNSQGTNVANFNFEQSRGKRMTVKRLPISNETVSPQ